MAKSPSHKWGQTIGDFLELTFEKELAKFARKHKLYLDQKGERKARKGKKVSWIDSFGNAHDLDFVLERNGTNSKIGSPVAFIESAWRRYTKHSRNKAQEIQGAILPLVATHRNYAPFMGVVLGGVFTQGAITQLKSLGFDVLYFSYDTIVKAFSKFGIDASFEENTPIAEFDKKILQWEQFEEKDKLAKHLLRLNKEQVTSFFEDLEKCVSRYITSVQVIALHRNSQELDSIQKAIEFIESYSNPTNGKLPLVKYEITIKYNNGDKVEGTFNGKEDTLEFLNSYSSPKAK